MILQSQEAPQRTKSVCKECMTVVDAQVVKRQGKVYLQKNCPRHGFTEILHVFDFPLLYDEMQRIFCAGAPGAVSPHDLIIYITSNCNMNCPVCYEAAPADSQRELLLSDIEKILTGYKGRAVHLSGGEPTLRDDIFEIISMIKRKGFFAGIFTNGIKCKDAAFVRKLKEAGTDLVILQFDSLEDEPYIQLRGKAMLEDKLKAFKNISQCGMGVYLFSAVVEGVNDSQIPGLVEFSKKHILSVDILNFNPVWRIGRFGNFSRIPASKIFQRIQEAGISPEEIISCTEFSHILFEIEKKLRNKSWVRQPPCAQRFYFLKIKNEAVKINSVLDLNKMIDALGVLNKEITGKGTVRKWIFFFLNAPRLIGASDFFRNKKLRNFIFSILFDSMRQKNRKNPLYSRILSVMIGAFHGPEDADMHFINKCTLYANSPKGNSRISACLRQMQCGGLT